jgi:hypothetical protein
MTPEERERVEYLCKRITEEKDSEVFNSLVQELNDFLDSKQERLRRQTPNRTDDC